VSSLCPMCLCGEKSLSFFRIPATSDVDFVGAADGVAVSRPWAGRDLQIEFSFGLGPASVAIADQENLAAVADLSQESSRRMVGAGRLTPLSISCRAGVVPPSAVDHQI